MASGSRNAKNLKAKEAKQKKILAAVMVVFLGLMVIQVPKILHHGGNAVAAPPVPAPAATPLPGVPAAGATTALAPPGVAAAGATSAVPGAAPASSSSGLADTDVAPSPTSGQLVQFDLFASKDPFIQQVQSVSGTGIPTGNDPDPIDPTAIPTASAAPTPDTPASSPVPSGIGLGGTASAPAGGGASATAATAASVPSGAATTLVAELSVNGLLEPVQAGRDFPSVAPAFRLVSFTSSSAKVAVSGGEFQSGSPTIELYTGKPVTLMNTADGTKYLLVFRGAKRIQTSALPQPVPAPAVAAAPAAAAPPVAAVTTTPSTTTTTTTSG